MKNPIRNRHRHHQPGENPVRVGESQSRGQDPGQGIGDSPTRVTEGKMSRINVGSLLFVAVGGEQFDPPDADEADDMSPVEFEEGSTRGRGSVGCA